MSEPQAMLDKVWFILPEIWLFFGAVVVSMMGLSRRKLMRDAVPFVVCFFLAAAMAAIPWIYGDKVRLARADLLMPELGPYIKMIVCGVGIVLAMPLKVVVGLVVLGASLVTFPSMMQEISDFVVLR